MMCDVKTTDAGAACPPCCWACVLAHVVHWSVPADMATDLRLLHAERTLLEEAMSDVAAAVAAAEGQAVRSGS